MKELRKMRLFKVQRIVRVNTTYEVTLWAESQEAAEASSEDIDTLDMDEIRAEEDYIDEKVKEIPEQEPDLKNHLVAVGEKVQVLSDVTFEVLPPSKWYLLSPMAVLERNGQKRLPFKE
jgi:hypothetical protein